MNSTTSGDGPQEMQYHPFHFALLVGFSGVAITAVILRLWARKVLKQTLKVHDYLIVLGLVRTTQSIIDWPRILKMVDVQIFALAETSVSIYSKPSQLKQCISKMSTWTDNY